MISIIILFCVAFVQNIAFTWSSRSRNSGDPSWHRLAAYFSNGIWFLTNILIMKQIWQSLETGSYLILFITGIVYCIATSEGSTLMMKWMLKKETGKRKVGG